MSVVSFFIIVLALVMLSSTLVYPYKKLFAKKPKSESTLVRAVAYCLLLLSIFILQSKSSISIALTLWFALLMVGSLMLALIYSYLPKNVFKRLEN